MVRSALHLARLRKNTVNGHTRIQKRPALIAVVIFVQMAATLYINKVVKHFQKATRALQKLFWLICQEIFLLTKNYHKIYVAQVAFRMGDHALYCVLSVIEQWCFTTNYLDRLTYDLSIICFDRVLLI